jgi:hypothetical protein
MVRVLSKIVVLHYHSTRMVGRAPDQKVGDLHPYPGDRLSSLYFEVAFSIWVPVWVLKEE